MLVWGSVLSVLCGFKVVSREGRGLHRYTYNPNHKPPLVIPLKTYLLNPFTLQVVGNEEVVIWKITRNYLGTAKTVPKQSPIMCPHNALTGRQACAIPSTWQVVQITGG